MHVNAKRVAFLGVSMALSVILVILSGVIETNTLFLLGLASFFTGIAIGEYGLGAGASYMVGSFLLALILAPNKLYVLTYGGICLYLVATEFVWKVIMKREYSKTNRIILNVVKAVVFNLMYIPLLIFAPSLILSKKITGILLVIIIFAGQAVLIAYDYAYHYFMNHYWLKYRHMINN